MNELAFKQGSAALAISDSAKDLIRSGVSENTLKAYRRALDGLSSWLNAPLDDAVLAEYAAHLHQSGKSPSTISQVVAAVKWQAKNLNRSDVVGAFTERTLAGIRREGKGRGRGQVDGLNWSDVARVCSFAEASRTLSGLRDSAMINLMSDCLLRISEAVAVDVEHIRDKTLEIQSSKTDQEAEGDALYITSATRRVIKRYRKKAGIESGALFRRVRFHNHVTGDRLSVDGARDAIKRWSREAGVEGFISGHSLRVGSAVSLAQAGASVVEMQTAGRWKSPSMPGHYARAVLAERGAIARYKEGK